MKFGLHIKRLREEKHLLQRQLANSLDMDTAMLSKIERGERRAKRKHIYILAKLLQTKEKELLTIWMADQVYNLVKEEDNANEILTIAKNNIKKQIEDNYTK